MMEPVETDGGLHIAGESAKTEQHTVIAPLEQLFSGLRMGLPSLTVQCCRCGIQLGEGEHVSVYAYWTVETPRWHLARCRCLDCTPGDIDTPTLGATEVHISARLATVSDTRTQQHSLCLIEPNVATFAPPADGTSQ